MRSGLFGPWDKPDAINNNENLPPLVNPTRHRVVGYRHVHGLAEHHDPDLGAGLVPHVPLLAEGPSKHLFEVALYFVPPKNARNGSPRRWPCVDVQGVRVPGRQHARGHPVDDRDAASSTTFVLNDQEILCRHHHAAVRAQVEAGGRPASYPWMPRDADRRARGERDTMTHHSVSASPRTGAAARAVRRPRAASPHWIFDTWRPALREAARIDDGPRCRRSTTRSCPRMADIIEYCNGFDLDDLPDDVRNLLLLTFAFCEASFPVEAVAPAPGARQRRRRHHHGHRTGALIARRERPHRSMDTQTFRRESDGVARRTRRPSCAPPLRRATARSRPRWSSTASSRGALCDARLRAATGGQSAVGGLGGPTMLRAVVGEEIAGRELADPSIWSMIEVLAPTDQRVRHRPSSSPTMVPRFLRGDETVVPGLLRARRGQRPRLADAVGPHRSTAAGCVNGQKVWTSYAQFAQRCVLLTRTGEPGSAHRGITAFFVDVDSPGITPSPIEIQHGRLEFAEVFYDDVFVPDDRRLGEVGQGWQVAMDVLPYERSTTFWHRGAHPPAPLRPNSSPRSPATTRTGDDRRQRRSEGARRGVPERDRLPQPVTGHPVPARGRRDARRRRRRSTRS